MFPSRTILFIGGLHRSGTSPLFKALRDHPDISGFADTGVPEDEGQHLQSVYPAARVHGGPGLFGFNPASHLTEESPLATEENAAQIFAEWSRHWDLARPVLMEKSPPTLVMTRFLQRLFPGGRFLVLLRHPIAVSLATQKWSNTSLDSLIKHWVWCHEVFLSDAPSVRQLLVMSYEGLLAEPAAAWEEIAEFVGLEPEGYTLKLEGGFNEKYFERWNALDRSEREQLIESNEQAVSRFGYSLRDPLRDDVRPFFARAFGQDR